MSQICRLQAKTKQLNGYLILTACDIQFEFSDNTNTTLIINKNNIVDYEVRIVEDQKISLIKLKLVNTNDKFAIFKFEGK